mmetsp:Transcript_15533/g.38527  ORF Transcript_15533/g.38527 Transcript_15533/m.38527 type:complete len:329 (-) Transcript_15533:141-1127(-)
MGAAGGALVEPLGGGHVRPQGAAVGRREAAAGAQHGWPQRARLVPRVESQPALLGRARLAHRASRRAHRRAPLRHAQGPRAGGVRPPLVAVGHAARLGRQRQPAQRVGRPVAARLAPLVPPPPSSRLIRPAALPAGATRGRGQGPRLVPVAAQPSRLGRRHRRPHHPLLELELGRLPQRCRHTLAGVRTAVVGARQGARLLAGLLAQPAHPVEVPLDGARRRAARAHESRAAHGAEPRRHHDRHRGCRRDAALLEDSGRRRAEADQRRRRHRRQGVALGRPVRAAELPSPNRGGLALQILAAWNSVLPHPRRLRARVQRALVSAGGEC